jgi:DNA-binding response OmpR family regulator
LAGKKTFDLILTDLQMPVMTGAELISALEEKAVAIPTFVITGVRDKRLMKRLVNSGCADYLEKPFDFGRLVERVESVLDRSQRTPRRAKGTSLGDGPA